MRAATAGTPSERKRVRISPAARAVNVRAKTLCGSMVPIAAAYAIRCVIARVLPVPAPAITQTGPRVASATARCSLSSASRISSARRFPTASTIHHHATDPVCIHPPACTTIQSFDAQLKFLVATKGLAQQQRLSFHHEKTSVLQ
ncbi:unannotated protein [freshwater metagenome]|uniref:Unannotated protein n=1 Tax=freshwater metagenome TaxID=449393 RepID=A0A6J6B7E1_9ZZZZ